MLILNPPVGVTLPGPLHRGIQLLTYHRLLTAALLMLLMPFGSFMPALSSIQLLRPPFQHIPQTGWRPQLLAVRMSAPLSKSAMSICQLFILHTRFIPNTFSSMLMIGNPHLRHWHGYWVLNQRLLQPMLSSLGWEDAALGPTHVPRITVRLIEFSTGPSPILFLGANQFRQWGPGQHCA